ncbi:MAG: TetR/AcrR family transcriptional regulator [Myxococcales bacterium]|nr:TetR/AcrR family transcriptional regulator [Myxococcales bacterium]
MPRSTRRARSDGQRSRRTILEAATSLATVEGLQRLSLSRLAKETGMSKSGVFGLFGSKEELQLATVDWARRAFLVEVVVPAMAVPEGREQLLALCEGFVDYLEGREWPTGCFFATVAADVGGHPGPVRDRVADNQQQWVALLARNAQIALERGELPGCEPDAGQLALELSTMLTGADIAYLLHGDPAVLTGVRAAIRRRCNDGLPGASEPSS